MYTMKKTLRKTVTILMSAFWFLGAGVGIAVIFTNREDTVAVVLLFFIALTQTLLGITCFREAKEIK
jgi:hypothetical protein